MKNAIKIIVLAAAIAASASCQHKSEFITYSYVLCDASKLSVQEDATGVVAVSAYSHDGSAPSTEVSFEIIEGTGTCGIDYNVSPENGVLTFNSEDTQYITITPVNRPGKITGDFSFTIRLTDATDGYTIGGSYATVVTIEDLDAANAWTFVNTGAYAFGGYYIKGGQTGLELFRSDVDPNRYKIAEWGYTSVGGGLYFTWDRDTDKVHVENQFINYVSPDYGDVWICETDDYKPEYASGSYYSNGVFYFSVIYYVSAGAFGYGYETFTLADSAAPDYSSPSGLMTRP